MLAPFQEEETIKTDKQEISSNRPLNSVGMGNNVAKNMKNFAAFRNIVTIDS
jgi:hypothetical protein